MSRPTGEALSGYTPTQLETAFDLAMLNRFDYVKLEEPVLEDGRAVRLSYPVRVRDYLLAFQHTRYDVIKDHKAIDILKPFNPALADDLRKRVIGTDPDAQGRPLDEYDEVEIKIENEKSFIEAIKARIIAKDGAVDPRRGLTELDYYTEGKPLRGWMESCEFVIIDVTKSGAHSFIAPEKIGRGGEYQQKRADVYGILNVTPETYSVELSVYHPRQVYETVMATLGIFTGKSAEDFPLGIYSIDDYVNNRLNPTVETSLEYHKPAKTMAKVGDFIQRLVGSR